MNKALIIGGGGREHAIASALKKEGVEVHLLPGNDGMKEEFICHSGDQLNLGNILSVLQSLSDALVIIGPEAPLDAGIAGSLREKGFKVFGPDKKAAMLESSKDFAKEFMNKYGIPTAPHFTCASIEECDKALNQFAPPYVIKSDGLSGGKGVFIITEKKEALERCQELLDGMLAEAGKMIVIEKFLNGREVSCFAMFDGEKYVMLPSVQDYKKLNEGNLGPNTGGMGSFTPVPWVTDSMSAKINEKIILPTVEGLRKEDFDYKGIVYFGIMIMEDEEPMILEYNVRFGDPEAQSVITSSIADWYSLILQCAEGNLEDVEIITKPVVTVVLASGGYPGEFEKGHIIEGIESITEENVSIFYSGVKMGDDQKTLVTAGGRVLSVTAVSSDPLQAREMAYNAVKKINFKNAYYRKDIAER